MCALPHREHLLRTTNMFWTKLLLILPLVVAVTIGQANRGEQGQWLFFSPLGRPMPVTGPVIAAPEAPVPIPIPASQPGELVVNIPLPDEPVPTGQPTPVTEQPPASKQNVYYIILLQPEPVTQYPLPTTIATPLLPKIQPVREPGIGPHQSSVPPMTYGPTGSHPSSFAIAGPQRSAIGEPQPPITEAAPLAPTVVVTTQSHPAVTQATGQLMFDFQFKEENGYYSVEHECDTYIECKQNRAMKHTCPDGLHFNPAAKHNEYPCAHPSEVKCMPGDQEQSPELTAARALMKPVGQPEPVTQYPPPTPTALPPLLPMTSYSTGSHPTQTPSPPRTVATQAPPVVVSTQSHLAVTQAPAAPPALAAPSYATVLHPRPLYTPVYRQLVSPRPIRLAPPAVAPPQRSAIGEPQPPVTEAAPLAPPVIVTTQSHPAVTQAPGQLMFNFQCKEGNGYYSVEHQCDTYIECKQNRAMKHTCPDGLHFYPAAKHNEYPCAYPSGDQEQSPELTAARALMEPVGQPEPVTQYPPPTPTALPPLLPMTSYSTGSHPTQTPSPPRTVATQAPPVVVSTQSHLAVTQAPAAPPALAAPSYATVLHPRPLYTPVYSRLVSPRPIRLAPPAVASPQRSAIGEPQPPVTEAAPLAPPVVVTTQSHPAVTQAPGQLMFDFQCKEGNGYYSVEYECDTYIECKQNRAMKHTCPDGLHFNPAAKHNEYPCAYPSEVKCMPGDNEQRPEPSAECPHQYGFYSMNDGDCSQYIRCHEGLATIMKCPKGLAFNPQKSICDWPADVTQCNLNGGEMK